MKGARPDVELGRNPGADQARGEVDILVDEEVERAGADERRRKAGKVGRTGRRGVRRNAVLARNMAEQRRPSEMIALPVPDEFAAVRVGVADAGAVIDHRVDQMLERERELAAVASCAGGC